MRPALRLGRLLPLAFALVLPAGCASRAPGSLSIRQAHASNAAPAQQAALNASTLLPLPAAVQRYINSPGGSDAIGSVAFSTISAPALADSAASYHVASMPLAHAMIELSDLEEDLYAQTGGGQIVGATDANGHFSLKGVAPAGTPYLVDALLANDYRLSGIVLPAPQASGAIAVDEATTMVAETARWQLRTVPASQGQASLNGVTGAQLADLTLHTRNIASTVPIASTGANGTTLGPLRQGEGFALRNAYVGTFGAAIDAAGSTDADLISDDWKQILGYRPLALTTVAGTGNRGAGGGDGNVATTVDLDHPTGAAADAAGKVYFCENASNLIRVVSPGASGTVTTVVGTANATMLSDSAFDTQYAASEASAVADPTQAPPIGNVASGNGYPIFAPCRVLPVADGGNTDLYFTSDAGHRVMCVPGGVSPATVSLFGRTLRASSLYTIGGNANLPAAGASPSVYDGQPADQVPWAYPTGLARDAQGNLFVLDRGGNGIHGSLRVIRKSDGLSFSLPVSLNGSAIVFDGARDLALSPSGTTLFVAHTQGNYVFSLPVPNVAALSGSPATIPGTLVLGQPNNPGFLDLTQIAYPAVQDLGLGVPQGKVLLNQPGALCFDANGNLAVADVGRVRLLQSSGLTGSGGQVFTLAGGLATNYMTGDARLCSFPDNEQLSLDATTGDLLVTDGQANMLRRLWLRRGI